MDSQPILVDSSIYESIPIQRKFKSFTRLKFNWIARHNGVRRASDVFSEVRTSFMSLISGAVDEEEFVTSNSTLPRRYLREMVRLGKPQPHAMLDLLKIYTELGNPVVTPQESAVAMHQRLTTVEPAARPAEILSGPRARSLATYDHVIEEFDLLPDPSWYKDFDRNLQRSLSYDKDVRDLVLLSLQEKYLYLLMPVLERLPDFRKILTMYMGDSRPAAGEIHHIPKKGTVKRRPIAAPNRFIQAAFGPLNKALQDLLYMIPSDCTFDQSRPIRDIQSRLDSGLYVGSADLSAASDNIPRFLGLDIVRSQASESANKVLDAFEALSEDIWVNGDFLSSFTKGQPLGVLISFPILALSNHAAVWVAYVRTYGKIRSWYDVYRRYYVLGDDVIFFDKSIREEYITLMNELGVPLSLHKSYEGNLVEFAGRIFIRNQHPWYTPDHGIVYWSNLFDWTNASGIRIPWDHLPRSIQRRWSAGFRSNSDAMRAYRMVSGALIGDEASIEDTLLVRYFTELLSSESSPGDIDDLGRLVPLFGTLWSTGKPGSARKDRSQTDWWRKKFRQHSTDKIHSCAVSAFYPVDTSIP